MEEDAKAPLLEHLIELRNRLMVSVGAVLVGFVVCFNFSDYLFEFLAAPLRKILGPAAKMYVTAPQEAFFIYIKLAFFSGLFLALPIVLSQLWLFVAPGLYKHEKRAFLPFLVVTPALFFMGGALAYFFVFPLAFKFFLGMIDFQSIDTLITMKEYLNLVIKLIFAFGLTFELPVGLLLLIKSGAVSTESLAKKRKYNIVVAFIAAAILTPPDPFTQVFLALPIMAMYELSILAGRRIERKRAEAEAAQTTETDEAP